MKTKNGIELDLKQSEYFCDFLGAVFYFSSELYLNKFKEIVKNYVEMEQAKFINKYKINVDLKFYFAVSLYKKIEKRGFRINYFDQEITEDIKFEY